MTLSLSRKFPRNLYLGTLSSPVFQYSWPTSRLSSNHLKRYLRVKRQKSHLFGKFMHKRALLQALSNQNSNKPLNFSLPKMHDFWTRRLWFLNNALPLAIQLKPMKPNHLFGLQMRAVLPLKIWVGQEGIHFLKKVATISYVNSFKFNNHHVWDFIQALECYPPIILTRLGFTTYPNNGNFWAKHHGILKNGFVSESVRQPFYAGDVCQNQTFLMNVWIKKQHQSYISLPKAFFNDSKL